MLKSKLFRSEHDHFRQAFNTFIDREIDPYTEQWEEDGMTNKDVWLKAGDQGFLCPWVDEQYGGADADFLYSVVTIESMGHRNLTAPQFHLHDRVVTPYIARFGSEEQKQRWLPGCVSGEKIACIGMTEPSGGSDLANIKTRAVKDGDSYVINGQKTFISCGQICDLVVLACRTDPDASPPHKGISLFVVEAETPGFERGRNLKKIGRHANDTAELFFKNCRVGKENLLGEEGKGFYYLMQNLQEERMVSTLGALANAEWVLEHTVQYVKSREMFGTTLSTFQNTQFKLAEVATQVQLGRTFMDRLIESHMAGESVDMETSMAKWWITEMNQNVASTCLQMFGGYGYMKEYPISKAYVDSRVAMIYAGTNEVMKSIIAKRMGL